MIDFLIDFLADFVSGILDFLLDPWFHKLAAGWKKRRK